ncbi:Bifunctional purine biosynthesis protein PurH [Salinivirga cyanobacteriivorans]|uniref:Bifunctional purine biosynthesis protein PurH n=1 Tax=Salinivirga cyanobacteriivorans TaxID=1307839 RepID=A0A0S2I1Y8_9BACT|nr:bifunctional phosphoribosylaminoimidazolecarboxamide formyltransferase/IMP cyclohydrolase [Salinivirga cyanobacteriivorans]ALO16276.1 Bifunctional purine biosynthesis protein PurH [Salinivirga cyanobacteriivorans]
MGTKKITSALISVFNKDGLEPLVRKLDQLGVKLISTGGTQKFISDLGCEVQPVEDLTDYPSILGGRVKTLHPKVFGGILARRDNDTDKTDMQKYAILEIDLVIVDLYPFEETLAENAAHQEIIEKIDIGGISLIRAAAKNYNDTLVVSSRNQYVLLQGILEEQNGDITEAQRKIFAAQAFNISSHYDTAIYNYLSGENENVFKQSIIQSKKLRYGENPHQKGFFYGDLNSLFDQLNGKEISYNNLLDIDAAVNLIDEFDETTFAILKHNNACGIASREKLIDAWTDALAGDPVSAFGGILITNREVNVETALKINKLFFEVIIAPGYQAEAFEILKQNKKRIILRRKDRGLPVKQFRSLLNGVLGQEKDLSIEGINDFETVTEKGPTSTEAQDLVFANKIVKHTKSNAIVLAKNKQLTASGVGQTSRVDALKQAIEKARNFKLDLNGAVMASDAFFPFSDSVEIADKAGVKAVIQPGGSIRDKESIEYCNKAGMAMVFTGKRHFKH